MYGTLICLSEYRTFTAQRTAAARKNDGRDMKVTTQITPRGVDDDASVIDVTDSDDESEFEGENEHFPAEGVDQERNIKSEDSEDSGVPPQGVPPQDAGLRRSSRVRVPERKFIPTMKGQRHDEGVHKGVGFP